MTSSLNQMTSSIVNYASQAASTILAATDGQSAVSGNQSFVRALREIPGILYWLITFSTITLPTWLFTLFSMSLTFTMSFTTV